MKLLIATPLSEKQVGGPSQYAVGLRQALVSSGHQVSMVSFSEASRYLSGVRHLVLFFSVIRRVFAVEAVIVLDTFSIALPVVLAASLLRKKVIIRTGGDFVWEHYVERTGEKVLLSEFYITPLTLSLKERVVWWLQKHLIIPCSDVLVFSTAWQRDLWAIPYALMNRTVKVIENSYQPFVRSSGDKEILHDVVWIGREIFLKNTSTLECAIATVKMRLPNLRYKKYSGLAHQEVRDALEQSRMLVIPSLSEVSPNLALEALALGVPVLLTIDCGLKDQLDGYVSWVDPRNPEALAKQIAHHVTTEGYEAAQKRAVAFSSSRTYEEVAREFMAVLYSDEKF